MNVWVENGKTQENNANIENGQENGDENLEITQFQTELDQITVTDPVKHGEGTAAFVSYLVISPKNQVRRRFQDFVQLQKWLQDTYPACIIPTLPGKAHSKYIVGDRFDPEFLAKRKVALQCFADRINRHPTLSKSECFAKFLQADQMVLVDGLVPNRDNTLFDHLTEGLLNAFTKVKVPDDRFQSLKNTLDKLESNVIGIERLHQRALKVEKELAVSFSELGGAFESLGSMESQVAEPVTLFGTESARHVAILKEKISSQDLDYVSPLHNYVTFLGSVRESLKLRDQKQIDHEELNRFLNETVAERDRTRATGKSPGIGGFFKDKINDFKGVDPEKTRKERLDKLEVKILELGLAVESSKETSASFSTTMLAEMDFFNQEKKNDFKTLFRSFTDAQLLFHEKEKAFWNEMGPIVDQIRL